MYQVRIKDAAGAGLTRIDNTMRRRILAKISWLAENADSIEHEGLHGEWKGLYKLRVGDFRIIYRLVTGMRILAVHHIGHRSEVYKGR